MVSVSVSVDGCCGCLGDPGIEDQPMFRRRRGKLGRDAGSGALAAEDIDWVT